MQPGNLIVRSTTPKKQLLYLLPKETLKATNMAFPEGRKTPSNSINVYVVLLT
jgi:hypothetical protein